MGDEVKMIKTFFRKVLSFLLIFCILALSSMSPICAAAVSSPAKAVGPINVVLQKKATISLAKISTYDKSGITTTAVLNIAKKYYTEYLPKVEVKLKTEFNKLAVGKATFDGKLTDEKTAANLTNIATTSSINPNGRNFSTALACVAFSKAAKKNIPAHNMAAVINLLDLPVKSALNSKADAIVIYEYAVSLNPRNVDTLVNLGNVYMDKDRQEDAKIMFEAALKIIPKYNRAREGMAAYWLARGDKVKAEKELQEDKVMMGRSVKVIDDNNKILADPKRAPLITPNDSIETSKAAINALSKLKVISTADFIEGIDPIDAQQIRLRINHMPAADKLVIPDIHSIASISTYKIFQYTYHEYYYEFEDYFAAWEERFHQRADLMFDSSSEETDISDEDFDTDELEAEQKENSPKNDLIASYIQDYNDEVLTKKILAYTTYLHKTQQKLSTIIEVDKQNLQRKIEEIMNMEEIKLASIGASGMNEEARIAAADKVTKEHRMMRNNERDFFFQRNYGMMVSQYIQDIKPTIEKMWTDCIPHIKLIKDVQKREFSYNFLLANAMGNSEEFINLIFDSGNISGYEEVSQAEIDEAGAALENALEKAAAIERAVAADIAKANTPQKLSEGSLLDKLSFKQELGPFELKITATGIEVSGSMLIEGKLSYDWENDTLTAGLGVGVGISGGFKGAKGEVGVGTMLTVTIDGKTGGVSEIDWKANADASVSVGSFTAGGGYEASVMHGNKFTPAVNVACKQLNFDF